MNKSLSNKKGFFISVGCPACGGSLEIDENYFVTICKHCDSVLKIIMPSVPPAFMAESKIKTSRLRFYVDRFLKTKSERLTSSKLLIKKLYYPYWKVDATLLKLRNRSEKRVVYSEVESSRTEAVSYTNKTEISLSPYSATFSAGVAMDGIPETLGVRSDTITLEPYSAVNIDPEFEQSEIYRSWDDVYQQVQSSIDAMSNINQASFGNNITKLFTPKFSLIYFPYYIAESYEPVYRRFIVDSIVGRIIFVSQPNRHAVQVSAGYDNALSTKADVTDGSESGRERVPQKIELELGELDVKYHRCSNCGFDLPPEKSYVYFCTNCQQLRSLDETGIPLSKVEIVRGDTDKKSILVPFWWLQLPDDQAKRLSSILGLLQFQNRLLIPALDSSNFEAVNKLARRMSTALGQMKLEPFENNETSSVPVAISLTESVLRAKIMIWRELIDLNCKSAEIDAEISPKEAGLVFVPFHLENYFYIDSVINVVGMEKRLIS